MLVRDVLTSCLRRWYFVVVGLLLTGMGTYFVFGMVSPTYEADASMTLIPPKVAVTVGDNPYLYLGGLEQALGVLQVKVASPEVSGPLLEKYPHSQLTVAPDATTTGPIMTMTVTAGSPEAAMSLLNAGESLVPATLKQLQVAQNVPPASMISVLQLSAVTEPTKVAKKQLQMTVMAGVGGLAATLLLTGLLDRLMSRKRAQRTAKGVDGEFTALLSHHSRTDNAVTVAPDVTPELQTRKLRIPAGDVRP
ncbi:hypothetical protein [Arthrobacter wenxiniae]|uniref:Capsular polysaccharide biosynthesis protein n=1 Tax=Arthrobacter wenxiniae TaxID=2713570 RepID=A0A7Y7IF89_9MICC|nr:hypothetical protein [Arthrobacter wenxiniae]NVM94401.1 hypothetical protein [Arthrobacter wenxiniae]